MKNDLCSNSERDNITLAIELLKGWKNIYVPLVEDREDLNIHDHIAISSLALSKIMSAILATHARNMPAGKREEFVINYLENIALEVSHSVDSYLEYDKSLKNILSKIGPLGQDSNN